MKKTQMMKVGRHMADYLTMRDWDNIDELREQYSNYNKIANDVQNGEYMIWFDECRQFLKELYNETDEEANKYTDDEVWKRYTHCLSLMANHKRYIDDWVNAYLDYRTIY